MDDIVRLHESGQVLNDAVNQIDDFARSHLSIALHPKKTQINKIEHGVNFVGYIIKPWRKYIRRSTVSNLMRKMEEPSFWQDADVVASVNSYLGMLGHVSGYKARKKICQRMEWLGWKSVENMTKIVD